LERRVAAKGRKRSGAGWKQGGSIDNNSLLRPSKWPLALLQDWCSDFIESGIGLLLLLRKAIFLSRIIK
jgi:hypothetical protein